MYVYLITNTRNGKRYVGVTSQTAHRRWKIHVKDSKHGSSCALHRAIRKYGVEAFQVETVASFSGKHQTLEAEKVCIEVYATFGSKGYNMTEGGEDPPAQKGSKNRTARVNTKQVKEIREMYAAGVRQRELRKRFGLSKQTVSSIVRGHTRAHVPQLAFPSTADKSSLGWSKRLATGRTKGVYWRPARQKWVAILRSGGKSKFLGGFTSEQEALDAYSLAVSNTVQTS